MNARATINAPVQSRFVPIIHAVRPTAIRNAVNISRPRLITETGRAVNAQAAVIVPAVHPFATVTIAVR